MPTYKIISLVPSSPPQLSSLAIRVVLLVLQVTITERGYKIIATFIEPATVLWTNNTHVMASIIQMKACLAIPD